MQPTARATVQLASGTRRVLWVGGAGGLEVKPGMRVVDDPSLPDWNKPGSLATIEDRSRAEYGVC